MDKKKTGILIREARLKKNLTQNELGDILGVTNKAVSRWENGESFPDVGILESLAATLDLKIQDIVSGENGTEGDKAVNDVLRIAKLQMAEKKRKTSLYLLVGAAFLIYASLGYLGLSGGVELSKPVILFTLMFLAGSGIYVFAGKGKNITSAQGRYGKAAFIISICLLAVTVAFTWIGMVLVSKGIYLFGIQLHQVGPVFLYVYIAVYLLCLCILGFGLYEFSLDKAGLGINGLIAGGTIFLAAAYCNLLYRMSSPELLIRQLAVNTAVSLVCLAAAICVHKIKK